MKAGTNISDRNPLLWTFLEVWWPKRSNFLASPKICASKLFKRIFMKLCRSFCGSLISHLLPPYPNINFNHPRFRFLTFPCRSLVTRMKHTERRGYIWHARTNPLCFLPTNGFKSKWTEMRPERLALASRNMLLLLSFQKPWTNPTFSTYSPFSIFVPSDIVSG